MRINVVFDQNPATLPAGFVQEVNRVAQFYDQTVTTDIAFNLRVGFGTVGGGLPLLPGSIATSNVNLQTYTYAQLRDALVARATSADDMTALGNVPATDPIPGAHQYWASTVQATALGLPLIPGTVVQGGIGFENSPNVTWDYNPTGPVPAGQFDFGGAVAHEIAEVLGKNLLGGTTLGTTPNSYDLSDLFDYSAPGVRDLLATPPAFFSINGGATNLNNFYGTAQPMGDLGDWAASAGPDSWLAFSDQGVRNPFTPTDLRFLDVIGYSVGALPPGPPEPPPAQLPPGKIFLRTDAGQDAFWVMDQDLARVGQGANLPQTDPSWQVRAFTDVDSKGLNFSDLIWQNTNGTVAVWELQSDASGVTTRVGIGNTLGSVDPSWQVVRTAGDFDFNGTADVLYQNQNSGQLAIWELQNPPNGTGPVAFPNNQNQFNIAQNPGSTWRAFAAADFNGDGRAGILFSNADGRNYAIWEMQPNGPAIGQNGIFTFNEQVNLTPQDPSWSLAGVGNFDGGGTADILWRNTDGRLAIWAMTGTADGTSVAIRANGQFNIVSPGTNTPQIVDPSWTVAAVRDFNADGSAGILWQNNVSGQIAIWENFTEGPLGSMQASFTAQQNINPQPDGNWRVT